MRIIFKGFFFLHSILNTLIASHPYSFKKLFNYLLNISSKISVQVNWAQHPPPHLHSNPPFPRDQSKSSLPPIILGFSWDNFLTLWDLYILPFPNDKLHNVFLWSHYCPVADFWPHSHVPHILALNDNYSSL